MAGKNVTRSELAEAVYQKVDLSRAEAGELVGQVLEAVCTALIASENVKLSGFGTFNVRENTERIGRNPKTREAVPIEPRRVVSFSASPVLKAHVTGGR
jgi:integration host factor subunit alpha